MFKHILTVAIALSTLSCLPGNAASLTELVSVFKISAQAPHSAAGAPVATGDAGAAPLRLSR